RLYLVSTCIDVDAFSVEMEEEDSFTKRQDARSSLPQFEDERPLFHSNQTPPGPSEPFLLSGSDVKVPYTINRYLRDYQREGIKFIYHNYAKSRGCILGDDMGLGKTVQVIGFLAAVLRKTGTWKDVENNKPQFLLSQKPSEQVQKVFLIVAPLSLLYNWKDELDTWGHFRVVVVHGVRKDEELARVQRGRCEIALTTYETLRLCLDQFNSIDWAAVIVDEAHKIKNPKSQITQAMKDMRCKVRVGLTGTILQNNLEELWSVMDWAIPGCLGSPVGFKNKFSDPIEHGQKHTVTKRALAEGRKAVQDLAKRLSHWFLRRTKALISDQLPKKDDRVVYCSLTDFQRKVYHAVLETDDVTLLLQSSGKCHCGSGRPRKKCCYKLNADGVPVRYLYFSYLTILRKVANHVALLQSKEGTSKKQEKYVTAICEQVFRKFPDFTGRCKQAAFEAMSDPMYSGKMKVLQKLLNHFIAKKDKVLLFSLSTKLLDVLESYCMAEGLEYHRLDGNTKSKDRVKIVKQFNSSRDVNLCLVSTLAGGLGLNFVGANVVVLFDPTWNPANDLQAIDRAYRIGQCRDVTVFRLISLGTVEEIIYLRQIYKQQLQSSVIGRENARRYFEAVQGTDGQAGELFGIRNLFRLQTDGTCLTHRILEVKRQKNCIVTCSLTPHSAPVYISGAGFKPAGVLDFSSASEDEDPCCSRRRPSEALTGEVGGDGATCIGNMGLYDLLQRQMAQREQQEKDSDEDSSSQDEDNCEKPIMIKGQTSKMRDLSVESKEMLEGVIDSKQQKKSADHELLPTSSHKHNKDSMTARKNRFHKRVKFAEKRSEDDVPLEGMRCMKDNKSADRWSSGRDNSTQKSLGIKSRNSWQTSGSDKTQSRDEENTGTLDSLIGRTFNSGLQHVSYTHSNQKVVGSSRAEDRLSRAAVRDVFELNKHSQLLANQLPDSSELFGFDSVRDFAEEILKNDSEQRLSRLRHFYSQKSPELKNIIRKTFPKPIEPEPPPPSTARQRPTSKRAHPISPLKTQVEVPAPEVEDGRKTSKKKKVGETETSEVHLHCSTDLTNNKMKMPSTDKFSSSTSGHVPQRSCAPVEESKTNITTSSQPFKDKEYPSHSSQITDLIGDTSILDDLFKSKRQTVDQARDVKASTCTERAKSKGKDFWDILNEGNEESINKLTDLTEVEKICNSASVSAKSRSNQKAESSQLWKKNEKFLWKR
uniref:DNA excision repair protein ERCC-6-like 2 n=1 Tax=Sinocyclocheilus grahami TaxID=75366 RepID=A0A672RLZ4_SINGR